MIPADSVPLLQLQRTGCGITRRGFLRGAGFSALSLLWSDWQLALASKTSARARCKSVILIFNAGAPSHLDLWDMKPDAPTGIAGPYRPIATNVTGIRISELMPRLAPHADKYAVVRTVHHQHTQHNSGMYWSIVGRPYRIDNTLINPSRLDYPSFGTLVGWLARRDGYSGAMPPYVITPAPHCDSTVYITPGQFGSCLGAGFDPLVVNTNPKAGLSRTLGLDPVEGQSPERFRDRQGLLGKVSGWPGVEPAPLNAFDIQRGKALELVVNTEAQRAFDLEREPAAVRDKYGRHSWGQSHLLARRLIEAGVRFVTTVNGPSISWDTHKDNFKQLKDRLVPPMEQAFASLLEDLSARGLLDSTLVIWMGDFGRTPLINKEAGRDHWPQCYSAVLAGGGIRGGQYIGESDRTGSVPKSFPVTPADLHATVFTALGYDPHSITYQSPEGRPFPISEGRPIRALLTS